MWLLIIALYLILGIVILGVIAFKPRLFWPILIVVLVGTAGLMVKGYCLVDEYFVGCVILGGILAMLIGRIAPKGNKQNIRDYLHEKIFILMVVYMIIQSFRGMLVWNDLRLSRWVIYYLILGILMFIVTKKGFPVPEKRKMSLLISWSALIYFAAYLLHGFLSEAFRGISKWALQGNEWSGTAYAVFPLVIAVPAAVFLFENKKWFYYFSGLAVILISPLVIRYYDSRSAAIALITFLVFIPIKMGVRRFIPVFLIFLILMFFSNIDFGKYLEIFSAAWEHAFSMVGGNITAMGSDWGRFLHFKISFMATMENLKTFFFGYGINSNKFIMSQYLQTLLGVGSIASSSVQTTGFPALLIDTGWIGISLLFCNFFFVALKIFVQRNNLSNRIILLLSLFLTLLWFPITNLLDIMLFYFLIMPSGLLIQLGRRRITEQSPDNSVMKFAHNNN